MQTSTMPNCVHVFWFKSNITTRRPRSKVSAGEKMIVMNGRSLLHSWFETETLLSIPIEACQWILVNFRNAMINVTVSD